MWQMFGAQMAQQGAQALTQGLQHIASSAKEWSRQKKVLKNQIQWRVNDMRAAGLNPILAVSPGAGGNVSAPSGRPPGVTAGDMASMVQSLASAKALKAQEEKTKAETVTIEGIREALIKAEHGRNLMYTGQGAAANAQSQIFQVERDAARAMLPYVVGGAKALEEFQSGWFGDITKQFEEFRRRLKGMGVGAKSREAVMMRMLLRGGR